MIGANFTAYQEIKKLAHSYQPELTELPSYQHMIIGLISAYTSPALASMSSPESSLKIDIDGEEVRN